MQGAGSLHRLENGQQIHGIGAKGIQGLDHVRQIGARLDVHQAAVVLLVLYACALADLRLPAVHHDGEISVSDGT